MMMMMPLQSTSPTPWYASSNTGAKVDATPTVADPWKPIPALVTQPTTTASTPFNTDVFSPQTTQIHSEQATTAEGYAPQGDNFQPQTATSSLPTTDSFPTEYAPVSNYYAYPEYNASTPAYESNTAAYNYPTADAYANTQPYYPSSSYPEVVVPSNSTAQAKRPKQKMGLFEKVTWGLLATTITGVTSFAIFENRDRLFQTFPTKLVSNTKGFFQKLWAGIDGKATHASNVQTTLTPPVIITPNKADAFALLQTLNTYIEQAEVLGHTQPATTLKTLKQTLEALLKKGQDLPEQPYFELEALKEKCNQALVPIAKELTQFPEGFSLLSKARQVVASHSITEAKASTLFSEITALLPQLEQALKGASTNKKQAKKVETLSGKLNKAMVTIEACRLYDYTLHALKETGNTEGIKGFEAFYEPLLKAKQYEAVQQQLLEKDAIQGLKEHFSRQTTILIAPKGVLDHLRQDKALSAETQLAIDLLEATVQKQVKMGINPQAVVMGGGAESLFAKLLEQHPSLQNKVEKQLHLMGYSPTDAEISTVGKQATAFLNAFHVSQATGVSPVSAMLKNSIEESETLTVQLKQQAPMLEPLITTFTQQFEITPENKAWLLADLRKKTTAIEAGITQFELAYQGNTALPQAELATLKADFITKLWHNPDETQNVVLEALKNKSTVIEAAVKQFDRAYKGNKKTPKADIAQLRQALIAKLWEHPETTTEAQKEALSQASLWGKRPAWMPV